MATLRIEELDSLMREWGVLLKKGDFGELERRPDPIG